MNFSQVLQVIIGIIGILFLPGFLLTYIFFLKKEERKNNSSGSRVRNGIDVIERLLLSFALSMAVVPLVLFFLNKLGMRINKLNIIIVVASMIIIETAFLYFRKKSKSSEINRQYKLHDHNSSDNI